MKFLMRVIRHKWYVLIAGLRLGGIPIVRLLIHDMSKFSRAEWMGYKGRGGDDNKPGFDKRLFSLAWLHHKNHNPHHWEHWRLDGNFLEGFYPAGYVVDGFIPMPETYVREMVADMMGASMEYSGSWDFQNYLNVWWVRMKKMHPETQKEFGRVLYEIDIKLPLIEWTKNTRFNALSGLVVHKSGRYWIDEYKDYPTGPRVLWGFDENEDAPYSANTLEDAKEAVDEHIRISKRAVNETR